MAVGPLIGLGASIVSSILGSRSKKKAAASNRAEINQAYQDAAKYYLGAQAKESDLFNWMLTSNIGTIKQAAAQGRSDVLTGLRSAQGLLSPYTQAGQRSLGLTNFLLTGARPPAETGGAFAPTPEFAPVEQFVNPPPPATNPAVTPAPAAQPVPASRPTPFAPPHMAKGGNVIQSNHPEMGAFSKVRHGVDTDTVPAMLTPGEFVFSRHAVNALGLNKLKAMNAKHTPGTPEFAKAEETRRMQDGGSTGMQAVGYADGGYVSPSGVRQIPGRQFGQGPGVNYIPEYYAGLATNMGEKYVPPAEGAGQQAAIDKYNMDLYNRYNARMSPPPAPQNALKPLTPITTQTAPVAPKVMPVAAVKPTGTATSALPGGSLYGRNFLQAGGVVIAAQDGGQVPDTGPGAGRAYPTTWNVNNSPRYAGSDALIARAPAPLPSGFDVAAGGTRPQNQQVYGTDYFPGNLPGFEGVKGSADFFKLTPQQQGAYRMALYQQHSTAPGAGAAAYEASPLYEWQKAEGEKAINRALAARGRSDSSFGLNTLANFYRGLAAEEADKQYGRQWAQTQLGAQMALAQSNQLMQGAGMLASGAYKRAEDLTNAFSDFSRMQGASIDSLAVRQAANRWLQANGIVDANNMSAGAQQAMWQYLSTVAGNIAVNNPFGGTNMLKALPTSVPNVPIAGGPASTPFPG